MVLLKFLFLALFGLLPLVSSWAADACNDFSRWRAMLVTNPTEENGLTEPDTTHYLPSEFFSPDGAMVPDYNGSLSQVPSYYFRDTSCFTDDFELEVSILDVNGGGYHISLGMNVNYEPKFSLDFDEALPLPKAMPHSRNIEMTLTDEDVPSSPLRRSADTISMGFVYQDGILYYMRDGAVYMRQRTNICRVMDIKLTWDYGGGGINTLRFRDNTNNTTYLEDFRACEDMKLFEECPPDPEVELRARYEPPTCQDPTLRFFSESNVLEDFHWVAPDGTEFSTDQNPVIADGFSAMSGTYYLWGKLHRCATPVVVEMAVEIEPAEPIVDTVKVNACSDKPMMIDGVLVEESGFYREVKRTSNGACDSITIYEVYILHPLEQTIGIELCEGDSAVFNGVTYKEAGDFHDVVKSKISDCDSIRYEIHVTQHPSYFEPRYETICWGETLDGYSESGVYIQPHTSVNGCDSITQLHLLVLPEVEIVEVGLDICEGGFAEFNGKQYRQPGMYEDVVKSKRLDCDSIQYLVTVTRHPSYFEVRHDTICWGETLDGHSESGIYTDSLTSVNGCDSVLQLHLFVLPKPTETTVDLTVCEGDSVRFNGKYYKAAGHYADLQKSEAFDCDSVLYTIRVTQHPTFFEAFHDTICWGETLYGHTETGVYTDSLTSVNGCDSVLQLHLIVSPMPLDEVVDLTVCEGDAIEFNGITYNKPGWFADVVKSRQFDCDSIRYEIHVTQHPSYFEVRRDTICWGETLDGRSVSGVYTDSLTSVSGCDSLLQLHLFVQPKNIFAMPDARVCEGDTLWVSGEAITRPGDYEFRIQGREMCDTFVVVRVDVDPAFSLTEPADVIGCKRVEAQLEIDSIEGAHYRWTPLSFLSGADTRTPMVRTSQGISYKVVAARGACADSTSLTVRVSSGPQIERVVMSDDFKAVSVNATGGVLDYEFSLDGDLWQSSPIFEGDIKVGVSFAYVRDSFGCVASNAFYRLVPIYPEDHMSPNGDGIKDFWEVENLGLYKHFTVRIFDRFGKMLVEYKDFYPGWDGVYNGAPMPSTDYWYIISVDELDYETCGHFTLLRR